MPAHFTPQPLPLDLVEGWDRHRRTPAWHLPTTALECKKPGRQAVSQEGEELISTCRASTHCQRAFPHEEEYSTRQLYLTFAPSAVLLCLQLVVMGGAHCTCDIMRGFSVRRSRDSSLSLANSQCEL